MKEQCSLSRLRPLRRMPPRSAPHFPAIAAATVLLLALAAPSFPVPAGQTVGRQNADRSVLPVNQILTPAGRQVDLPGMRPQALALSPNGRLLAVAGKSHEVVTVDPATGRILQVVPLPSEGLTEPQPEVPSDNILKPDEKGQVSYTGLVFSPDGKRLYLSNVNGSIKVFAVGAKGLVAGLFSIPLPRVAGLRREEEIPAGLAVSSDGARLYAVLNLSNRLAEIEAATGKLLRTFDVGVAPYDVVLVGPKAYVSNWGGRRPAEGDVTGPAGRGTKVKVDPTTFIANEGSVTVIDLEAGRVAASVLVHLHASALAVSPDRRYVVCANAAPTTSASSIRGPTGSSRPSGRSRTRPTCSAPRPTPWRSTRRAILSTSPTAPRTPSPVSISSPRNAAPSCSGSSPSAGIPARSSITGI